jgi:class 3 adenylate cyclase/tetratricopeptide (TPR) repeat protein
MRQPQPMSELSDWLSARGLGALSAVLEAQQVGLDVLPDLTEDDLKELGIALGPRRRLLRAIHGKDQDASKGDTLVASPDRLAAAKSVDAAERRQLSVLFVDLVGSTSLSARRDPEEMRQILRRYQNTVAGEIARFDGYVAKFMGDGVLAYFGWPKAHEDEAERSVRAAMAAVGAVSELRTADGVALAARAGIATGLVVVGDLVGEGAAQEASVIGDTPNIAARLQELARPGQVVVAEATQRQVQPAFDFSPLGPRSIKGLDAPLTVFSVDREKQSGSRFEARAGEHLRPMVGRDQELAVLHERWTQAERGEGQCLLLVGEAGIGKSRIARALLDLVSGPSHTVLRHQCSPYHLDTPLWPIIQQLSFAARLSAEDSGPERLDKIETLLRAGSDRIAPAVPLIASLLGVPYEDRYGPLDLAPQVQRNRTLEALVEQLLGLATHKPVLVVMEDVHWIDPSTLEFVHLVLDHIEGKRVLVMLTSRPESQPLLAGHPHVTRLVLNRLGRAAIEAMTDAIEGGASLPDAVRLEIVARTDGVPLFVEELTRALVELAEQAHRRSSQATGPVELPTSDLNVPATLHDSLMSRLDRLPEVKRVAQVAACIGRQFDHRTLAGVAGIDERELQSALDRLVGSELVFRRGTPPEASYTFKHALVRDAAANSLLRSEFRRINANIAAVFEVVQPQPSLELIARHAELGGLDRKAIDYLMRAGDEAIARYANREAINHLDRAMRLIAGLAEGRERTQLELQALTRSGVPRIALQGYAAPEVEATYRRAIDLAESVGDSVQLFQALRGLWNCVYDRADLLNAKAIADRLLALAVDHPAPEARALALRAVGSASLSLGRFGEALEAFEKCVESCAGLPPETGLHEHGESPWIIGTVYAGWTHTLVGNFDRGLARIEDALAAVRRIDYPLAFAFAYHIAANAYCLLDNAAQCAHYSSAAMRVSEEHRLVFWLAGCDILGGWADVKRGNPAGIDRMRRGLHAWQTSGAELHLPTWQSELADALLALGALDEADEIVDRAMVLAQRRDEMFAVPVLVRLKGLIADRRGQAEEGEAHLAKAVMIARQQGARLYELRTVCDLARLMLRRGDHWGARRALEEACRDIGEASSVACVVEARELLGLLR